MFRVLFVYICEFKMFVRNYDKGIGYTLVWGKVCQKEKPLAKFKRYFLVR